MIGYIDETGVLFAGKKIDLISELTLIIRDMMKQDALTDADLDLIVETAKTPIEEIRKQSKEMMQNMSEQDKLLFGLFSGKTLDEINAMIDACDDD